MTFWPLTNSDFRTDQTFHQFHDLYTELDLHRIMSGFHGAFATGVASQQGTLTLPDTWFRPPFWDLLMFQLLIRTCHVFTRLFTSNTPWYFLDFAFYLFISSISTWNQYNAEGWEVSAPRKNWVRLVRFPRKNTPFDNKQCNYGRV